MSTENVPFGNDVMTIIMGIDPEAPGQHGPMTCPAPTEDAISLICNIKCMCEDFLVKCGKNIEEPQTEDGNETEETEDMKGE